MKRLLSILILPLLFGASIPSKIETFNRTPYPPKLLVAIAMSESGLDPTKIGITGDIGLFQVTKIAYVEAVLECPNLLRHTTFPASLLTVKWSTLISSCFINAVHKRHDFRSTAELLAYYNCGKKCLMQVRNGHIGKLNIITKNYILKTLINYEMLKDEGGIFNEQ